MVVSRFVIAIDTLVMRADGFKPACVRSVHWSSFQRRPVRVLAAPGRFRTVVTPQGIALLYTLTLSQTAIKIQKRDRSHSIFFIRRERLPSSITSYHTVEFYDRW